MFCVTWCFVLALVMRTQGSLRLILNTKLWAQMQIDKASEKSIRITAMDTEDQGVKVFLISVSTGVCLHLNLPTKIGARLNCSWGNIPLLPQSTGPWQTWLFCKAVVVVKEFHKRLSKASTMEPCDLFHAYWHYCCSVELMQIIFLISREIGIS